MRHFSLHIIPFMFLVLAWSTVSCTKYEEAAVEEEVAMIRFFAGEQLGTKAVSVTKSLEKNIDHWAVFLFDGFGQKVVSREVSSSGGIAVGVKPGTYTVAALVNYPVSVMSPYMVDVDAVSTLTQLESLVFGLGDNSISQLPMYGKTTITFTAGENSDKNINVKRLVSRIAVKKVSVDFTDRPVLNECTFTLKGIYCQNVYSEARCGEDFLSTELQDDRSYWYNAMSLHEGGLGGGSAAISDGARSLVEDTGLSQVVSSASPYEVEHTFYVFPNPIESADDSFSNSWCPRKTRLVFVFDVDGNDVYYTVTIGAVLHRNNSYTIDNAVIKRLGSSDPEQDLPSTDSIQLQYLVDGWGTEFTIDEIS